MKKRSFNNSELIKKIKGSNKDLHEAYSFLKRAKGSVFNIINKKHSIDKSFFNEIYHDCLVEVIMIIINNKTEVQSPKSFLAGYIKNIWFNHLKKKNKKQKTVPLDLIKDEEYFVEEPKEVLWKNKSTSNTEYIKLLFQIFGKEDTSCRTLLETRYCSGFSKEVSYKGIARIRKETGQTTYIEENAIKSKVSQCLRKARLIIKEKNFYTKLINEFL